MDEIIYIARIDARPWAKSAAHLGGLLPFALLFAAIEVARYFVNGEQKIPEFQKYFVVAVAAIVIVVVQDILMHSKMLPARWHNDYTTKMIQATIFTALISASLLDFAALYLLPPRWTVSLDPHGWLPDWSIRIEISSMACLVGITLVALRTHLHRTAEFRRLHLRPSAHVFRYFRKCESRAMMATYLIYYLSANAIISYLLIAAG